MKNFSIKNFVLFSFLTILATTGCKSNSDTDASISHPATPVTPEIPDEIPVVNTPLYSEDFSSAADGSMADLLEWTEDLSISPAIPIVSNKAAGSGISVYDGAIDTNNMYAEIEWSADLTNGDSGVGLVLFFRMDPGSFETYQVLLVPGDNPGELKLFLGDGGSHFVDGVGVLTDLDYNVDTDFVMGYEFSDTGIKISVNGKQYIDYTYGDAAGDPIFPADGDFMLYTTGALVEVNSVKFYASKP